MPLVSATEARFVPLEANLEFLSKYNNTKTTVDFKLIKGREPFLTAKPEPHYDPKVDQYHVPMIKMSKSKGHDFEGLIRKPFNIPNPPDLQTAQNSF